MPPELARGWKWKWAREKKFLDGIISRPPHLNCVRGLTQHTQSLLFFLDSKAFSLLLLRCTSKLKKKFTILFVLPARISRELRSWVGETMMKFLVQKPKKKCRAKTRRVYRVSLKIPIKNARDYWISEHFTRKHGLMYRVDGIRNQQKKFQPKNHEAYA